jgi:hypothetical protein
VVVGLCHRDRPRHNPAEGVTKFHGGFQPSSESPRQLMAWRGLLARS